MMIRIRNARYAGTIYNELPALPQVAFAGRSNVGKSSLINALLNRKSLVKTSKIPGKTRNVNFFRIDLVDLPSIYLVDLPGYGYAKVPLDMKDAWGRLASRYFDGNKDLKLLMILMDIRRDIGEEELMVLDLARRSSVEPLFIATKADKLSHGARAKRLNEIGRQAGRDPILASAHSKLGMQDIWDRIVRETAG